MEFEERVKALRPEADEFFKDARLGSGYAPLDEWVLEMAKLLWSGIRILREEYEMSDLMFLKGDTKTNIQIESRNGNWSVTYNLHDGLWNGSIRYMGNHICTASGCMTFAKCESELIDRLNELSHDLYMMSKDCLDALDEQG